MTSHLLCSGKTIWKRNLMCTVIVPALGTWREDQEFKISLGYMRDCQKIKTPTETDSRVKLGPLLPSPRITSTQTLQPQTGDRALRLICSGFGRDLITKVPGLLSHLAPHLPQGRFGDSPASSEDRQSRQNPQFWVGLVTAS